MASQRFPLKINVGFFFNLPVGSFRDIHFESQDIHLPPELDLKNFSGMVHLSRVPQGILCEGKFQGVQISECVRCLEPFDLQLNIEFEDVFAYKTQNFTESGLFVPDDGNIDIGPVVREYMITDNPIKPLCRPDCTGLCVVCGENLNLSTCEHQARIQVE